MTMNYHEDAEVPHLHPLSARGRGAGMSGSRSYFSMPKQSLAFSAPVQSRYHGEEVQDG